MDKEIVIFDFDGTLTVTDTMKFQILLLLLRRPWKIFIVTNEFKKYRDSEISINEFKKSVFFHLLAGRKITSFKFECYIFRKVYNIFKNKLVVELLLDCLEKQSDVIIATASTSLFVKSIFNKMRIEVIGIDFQLRNEKYTGLIDGLIPYKEDKVIRIEEMIDEAKVKSAYTDDYTDIPMLKLAEKKYMVSKDGVINEFITEDI